MERKISYIKARILEFAEHQGLRKAQIARQMGMTYHSFRGPAKERPLNSNAIEVLLRKYPQLSPNWLLLSEEPMLRAGSEEKIVTQEEPRVSSKEPKDPSAAVDVRALITEIGTWMRTLTGVNKISEEARLAYKRLADAERTIGELKVKLIETETQLAAAKDQLSQLLRERKIDKQKKER